MKFDLFKKMMEKCASDIYESEGFSLIEVLLAMAILSIGLLGVLSLHLNTSKINTKGNVATMATMIAQKRIEDICTGRISDSGSMLSNATAEGFVVEEGDVNAEGENIAEGGTGGLFTVQTRISEYTDPDPSINVKNLRRVSVTVSWKRGTSPDSITYSAVTRGNTKEI